MPRWVLQRDQRGELKQVGERWTRDLRPERDVRDEQVATLDGPLENRSRVTLRGDPTS
jgi:hypothetical protein